MTIDKMYKLLGIFCLLHQGLMAQTGNHVFSGIEAANYGIINLATPGGQTWSTTRSATPGYFSCIGAASYAAGSDPANINGYVKYYATSANQSVTFPVGTGTDLRQLQVSGSVPANANIAVAWIAGDPTSTSDPTLPNSGTHATTSVQTPILNVSTAGMWDWQDLGNNAAGVTVTVSIPDLNSFAVASSLRLVGWNGTQWIDLSGAATANGNTENSTLSGIMQNNITAIGIGTIGNPQVLNPDFNVTHINVPVGGNMSDNDNLVPGTNFGTPVTGTGNPSVNIPVMQTDGTYTFTPTDTGVYIFEVPVCPPGVTIDCPTETLTITVTDPYAPGGNNPPVVNPDISVVDSGSTVNIPVLDNDQPGNPGGSFGPPTPTDPPHGTVTTTPGGGIVYTPDPGFTGADTFTYTVCDTSVLPSLCGTTTITVNVNPPGVTNTILANDDYNNIDMNTTASGNVMHNDIDPDGDPIMVTAQNITTSAGTFAVDAMGNYTFTPTTGTFGPVQIPYTVCDTAGNCTTATLHVLINPVNTLEPDFNVTNINTQVSGNMSTNDELVSGSTFSSPVANTGNPTADLPTLNSNGSYSFTPDTAGVYTFYVPVCAPNQDAPCPTEALTITVLDPLTPVFPPVVNPDNATGAADSTITINIKANDDPTSPGGSFGTPDITTPPSNGTVVVNTDGTVDYTPGMGFTGIDSFIYTICDTVPTPDQCGSATVTVNILPPNATNSVAANDDYVNTYGTVPATGNVLLNDNDPEGGTLTVTSQNITTPQGTLSLSTNGQYTFTPASGFTGTTSFTYNVCDNGEPQACDQATLHILVDKAPDYTPTIYGDNLNFTSTDSVNEFVLAIFNTNNTPNKGKVQIRMLQSSPNKLFTIEPNMTMVDFSGGFPVSNDKWDISLTGDFYTLTLKPGVVIPANGIMFIGFKVILSSAVPLNQIQNVTATISYQSGGDANFNNNSYNIKISKN